MSKKTNSTDLIRLFSRITLLTQLGLSIVIPPILAVLLASWLQKRFGLGDWVILAAILLGVLSGISSVLSLVWRESRREAARDEKDRAGNGKEGKESE